MKTQSLNSYIKFLSKKSSLWYTIFLCITIVVLSSCLYKRFSNKVTEGFIQREKYVIKKGPEVYDDFYVKFYDDITYSDVKNIYEIGEIIQETNMTTESRVLDIGSGTGHHVSSFNESGVPTEGIDSSEAMVKYAKNTYPTYNYHLGDALDGSVVSAGKYTHITCLYFTIYSIEDKAAFLTNCYNWLVPGGSLLLHLVNRDKFTAVMPAADPFIGIDPYSRTKKRITTSHVKFKQCDYKADFDFSNPDKTILKEKFVNKQNRVRENEHYLYMKSQRDILNIAKSVGFIMLGKIDMAPINYFHNYIYILQKPN